jgi:cytochrome c peroxidase
MRVLVVLAVQALLAAAAWVPEPPLGLEWHLPVPREKPLTPEKVRLGERLFFDTRLSADGTLSCASCHDPARAFSDGRRVAVGVGGAEGARNAPALVNRGYGRAFFWDGRAATLEQQVLQPIFDRRELGLDRAELERRTGMPAADVANALASYVRTIRSGNSPFDRYVAGDRAALTDLEKRGLELFRGTAQCTTCHAGPNFTDEQFHNTGIAWRDGSFTDIGRFVVTRDERDRGAFKTPTLRDVARTAPYMHDGSLVTLDEVLDFYAAGGRPNPSLTRHLRPVSLSADDRRALIAFLQALTGELRGPFGP